ncbi:MAG: hypothetical protein GQ546_11770 [Gammaproteobacteria bacterium]|nr:hypothetical protein [Gammaproteobacteria bacterium]
MEFFLKYLIKFLSVIMVLFWSYLTIASDSTRILVIHSYSQDYPWTKGQHEGFVDTLKQISPIIKTEYLDTKRVAYESIYAVNYEKFIEQKYNGFQPDAIYITDDNALKFGLNHIHNLFPDTPLFFSGVNDYSQLEKLKPNLETGVFEKKEIKPNLDLLSELFSIQPGTQIKLAIVGDNSKTDYVIKETLEKEIKEQKNLSTDYISSNRLDSILASLRESDATIILLTTVGAIKDQNENALNLQSIITSIAQFDDKIVICMEDGYLFDGVLGGYVTSAYSQGKSAANLLQAYLNGTPMASLSPITKSPNEYIFNDKVLEILDLSLPKNITDIARILNPRINFYQRYKQAIQIVIVLLSLSLVVLSFLYFLFISRKNKQLSQANIVISEQANNLETEVLERTEALNESRNQLKLALESAIKSQQKAERANKAKSVFLANMSHELRTPMHGILSYAIMGVKRIDKSTSEKNLNYFSNIKTSGDRLLVLLNDLLDLAKLESGKMDMNYKQSSLQFVAQNCVSEQQARLDERNQKIIYMPDNITGEGFFDDVRIGQVITNLLSNAIKFIHEDEKIEFAISNTDLSSRVVDRKEKCKTVPALLFSVRDYGKGIPNQELVLVFDKFEQSSNSEVGTMKGTGLGLPISKEIINLHHGKIWAENHPDGGAVFSFIIPVEQVETELLKRRKDD